MLRKGTIPFKEKYFIITLFVAFVVVLFLLPPPSPILVCAGLPGKGCLLFYLLSSVIPSIDCFLALIVSFPNTALSCF